LAHKSQELLRQATHWRTNLPAGSTLKGFLISKKVNSQQTLQRMAIRWKRIEIAAIFFLLIKINLLAT
jgi:hypothetical protein